MTRCIIYDEYDAPSNDLLRHHVSFHFVFVLRIDTYNNISYIIRETTVNRIEYEKPAGKLRLTSSTLNQNPAK